MIYTENMAANTLLIDKCPHCKSTYKTQEFLMKHIESHIKKYFRIDIAADVFIEKMLRRNIKGFIKFVCKIKK